MSLQILHVGFKNGPDFIANGPYSFSLHKMSRYSYKTSETE